MNTKWYKEKFINRRNWILDHLDELSVSAEETLVLLLIDFMNEYQISVSHQVLAKKLKKSDDEIDDILSRLSAKGFLNLELRDGRIIFEIDGIFEGEQEKPIAMDTSLFDQYETEFGRPLSQMEMQRLAEWTNTYHQKMIIYALREALTYDKKSFDYIERILIEWKKRGLTPEEYEEGKR
ncbi:MULTISPECIES: DnaD domain-containing protein [Bacillota]|jgi:DNA replication protein|uniref:DnaD domain protein n=2 Tax=Amedibacillus TaxID=2749846 RepID=A0A7G9GLJ6_9FIRM|nr:MULTISPECIES: DnaD domain protein [Bacillota]QNM11678.1 DnaD domain protein [[Eubacterium] hominis]MCH4285073.1 DnaD domain protein [Amedibacillus hominis]RGB56102.1 DnaD domain protein [Absiella sp. AM22-9]RGB61863.1 DnaD domain protein [Absiella sp. AM10-20]RGB70314.1 DnaD domain protein [Absiella sp. AM09-45]